MRTALIPTLTFILAATFFGDSAQAQSHAATTRLKPLGAPSAVDQFRRPTSQQTPQQPAQQIAYRSGAAQPNASNARVAAAHNVTASWQTPHPAGSAAANPVRQTVWMQSGLQAPPLGGSSGMGLPPDAEMPPAATPPSGLQSSGPSAFPNSVPYPEANPQPNVAPVAPPNNGSTSRPLPAPSTSTVTSPSDLSPIAQPQLPTEQFARIDNCNLVTGPSAYYSASPISYGCGQVIPTAYAAHQYAATQYTANPCGPTTTTVVPSALPPEIPSAAVTPPVSVLPPATAAAPARALISFGQERNVVQVGQGLWGQPVAYVPGQGLRNWLRYFSP